MQIVKKGATKKDVPLSEETNSKKKLTYKEYFQRQFRLVGANKTCYLFLAPFAIIFILFNIVPVFTSIFFSFTDYNVLQAPSFVGVDNYTNLILTDKVFMTAIQNTLLIAFITGPIGYLMAFLFAWMINELPRYLKSVAVLIYYAPSISGNVYLIWTTLFSGDEYGYANQMLLEMGVVSEPIKFLTDPKYIMSIVLIVVLWASLGAGFLGFVAGLKNVDKTLFEAGAIDGIKNRWQELWFITLPSMKPMLLFGAIMAITAAFNVSDVPKAVVGYPSTDYAARTVVTHLVDYGSERFEMGYACAIATLLFLLLILCKSLVEKFLNRIGQ